MQDTLKRTFRLNEIPSQVTLQEGDICEIYYFEDKGHFRKVTSPFKKVTYSLTVEKCIEINDETFQRLTSKKNPLGYISLLLIVNNRMGELKIYLNTKEDGLKVVEVPFETEEDMKSFEPPNWVGEELTDNSQYEKELWLSIQ